MKKIDYVKQLRREIDLWLEEASKAEKEDYEAHLRYRSMAHALVMYGENNGLLNYDDYPQFGDGLQTFSPD